MWFSASKKAKEDIWFEGFQAGFLKAWDMMLPMHYSGFERVKEELITKTKIDAITNLKSALEDKNGLHSKKN